MKSMLFRLTVVVVVGMSCSRAVGQGLDSTQYIDGVVVSGYEEETAQTTTLNIEQMDLTNLAYAHSQNVAQAVSRLPGVALLSTGNAINKPVIRGLYGNRVLVLYSGLKLDNQQWQDEHGLGLSNFGIGGLELIKGPLAVLYGTEASGGVINILEEPRAKPGTRETDFGVQCFGNTAGFMVQGGFLQNKGQRWCRLRIGVENHSDYSDGHGNRVLNSRFNGYYLKGSLGFKKGRWLSENHYHFSFNRYGFIFSDMSAFFEEDARWSRNMVGPHHIVMLNLFSSQNKRVFERSVLEVNAGAQSNFRAEDEGGGALSLIMHLVNAQVRFKWSRPLSAVTRLVVSQQSAFETNTNYGGRKIVPNAHMFESNASAYIRHRWSRLSVEYGLGWGVRHITTLYTPQVNSEEKVIDPFSKNWAYPNAMAGFNYQFMHRWRLRGNVASGVRVPNLAELSSNGLHEGVYTYELGDPKLQKEQNLNLELGMVYESRRLGAQLSVFRNSFKGFVYLQPTTGDWFGFPVYVFRQHRATFSGVEGQAHYKLPESTGISVSLTGALLIGELPDMGYLPYMPANNFRPTISYLKILDERNIIQGQIDARCVMQQSKVAVLESPSPGYTLVDAHIQWKHQSKKADYVWQAGVDNLFNVNYYDHMSRLKTFGVFNMGRSISFSLKICFTKNLKSEL